MCNHNVKRQMIYQDIKNFWHDIYGTEYALLDMKAENESTIQRIRIAAERIGRIFFKTASLLRQLDNDTLIQLGFPEQTLSYIRTKSIPYESVIARLDLVVKEQEIKVLELNSDTPTFIKEAFHVNGRICDHFGCSDVNAGLEQQLAETVRAAIRSSLESVGIEDGKIVFTSHSDHEEDFYTSKYLADLCGVEVECIPIHELKIVEENKVENGEIVVRKGVYTPDLKRIDVLYRQTYPIEHVIDDEDPVTKDKVGEILLRLVEERAVALINPPSAFLLQSKAIMSLIWGLHEEQHPFFTEEEHEWIHSLFLPTYLDDDLFRERALAYVKKPSFGREGDTVQIFKRNGTLDTEDRHKTYASGLPVYQQYIELPKHTIMTDQGKREVSIMYGSFLLNGKASAIGIRAGGQITDNASYFLPVGYRKREE